MRPRAPPIDISADALFQHYHDLLATLPEGYGSEFLLGQGTSRDLDITPEEVLTAIRRLKNNKALGGSWISAELLKQLPDEFASTLAALFNHVRVAGTPPSWNKVLLQSLYKKGDRQVASNYRGLAVMGALPKLYATIMTARLDGELDARGSRAPT